MDSGHWTLQGACFLSKVRRSSPGLLEQQQQCNTFGIATNTVLQSTQRQTLSIFTQVIFLLVLSLSILPSILCCLSTRISILESPRCKITHTLFFRSAMPVGSFLAFSFWS
ncbi:hypothetical protein QBC46DRAFT_73039 [Diplogelasinospora grovesii]|uniref:Uncharacterized protein n=1 Tax=Diplogelasinospora grovesii TaxID=303347 RepID=A0AAN6RZA3_9PEZI|nr:hypothetical protein QBC46DRAFT_73039 [Diplogelasinospora grovesii]